VASGMRKRPGTGEYSAPDWSDCSHSIAFGAELLEQRLASSDLNAYWEPLEFDCRVSEPVRMAPLDRYDARAPRKSLSGKQPPPFQALPIRAGPRSVVVLIGELGF